MPEALVSKGAEGQKKEALVALTQMDPCPDRGASFPAKLAVRPALVVGMDETSKGGPSLFRLLREGGFSQDTQDQPGLVSLTDPKSRPKSLPKGEASRSTRTGGRG